MGHSQVDRESLVNERSEHWMENQQRIGIPKEKIYKKKTFKRSEC